MNALFADISTKRTSLISAKNALEAAKRDLTLSKAGTDLIKIQAQEALVSQAQANVTSAEARLSKTFIRAPFDGVVTDVAPVSGETVTATKNVVTMISSSAFEIESSIPEIDIAKVSLGDTVDVTLDAYGTSIVFPSTITRINPAATFEGNVPKYKIIATFKNKDDRIKSGMTANIKIVTKSIPSAMILPVRFVNVSDDTKGTVTVKQNNGIVERPVSFGIRSDDGYIEITSGLTGDEEIVAVQPGVRSAQKQTQ
jgi:RND family efflux transporter MFP subunit